MLGRGPAGARIAARTFTAVPGWAERVPAGHVVVTDQRGALSRLAELAELEPWTPARRARWLDVLRDLIATMDWDTGILCRTVEALAERAQLDVRTVRRTLSWARATGALVLVEAGASPQRLRLPHGRAQSFVMVVPADDSRSTVPPSAIAEQVSHQSSTHPRRRSRVDLRSWPSHDQPRTGAERAAAARTLVARLGLDARRLPDRAVRGALLPWWRAGWCVAGLLWALDHHPDDPERARGDALSGARDPIALLGYRLAPWRDRAAELPPAVRGVDPAERQAAAADRARRVEAAEHAPAREHVVTSSPEARAAARAAFAAARGATDTVRQRRTLRRSTTWRDGNIPRKGRHAEVPGATAVFSAHTVAFSGTDQPAPPPMAPAPGDRSPRDPDTRSDRR